MPRAQKFRNICFTDFNVEETHREAIHGYDKAQYVITGLEVCPTTGKQHLQGYAELSEKVSLTTLKALMPMAHLEERKGSADDAITYCKKENSFRETGERKRPGKRSDIATVKDLIKQGHGMAQVIETTNSYQALSFAIKALPFYETKRNWVPVVHWFWGPSGTGKTRTAVEQANANWPRYHMQKAASGWWQGYDAEPAVIIDEVRAGSALNFVELLALLDRYPHTVECKGSSRQFLAREIWLTSPYHPEHMYSRGDEELRQLLRRITEIRHFPAIETPVPEVRVPEVGGNTIGNLWSPTPPLPQVDNIALTEPVDDKFVE